MLFDYINKEYGWEFIPPVEMDNVNDSYWSAVDLMSDYPEASRKTFLSIIDKFPESHIDSYINVSIILRNQKKTSESFTYGLLAYLIGKRCFPSNFKKGKEKIPWLTLSNRPFLRACENLAELYRIKNDYLKAVEIYEENLSYNKNDNQGIRYVLLECYFHMKDLDKAKKILSVYPDDYYIDFACGNIILKILTGQKHTKSDIKRVLETNKFIIEEICKKTHSKPKIKMQPWHHDESEAIYLGSEAEAYFYWKNNKVVLSLPEVIEKFRSIKTELKITN